MKKKVQCAMRAGCVLSAIVSTVSVLVFIVVSFWGGFRIYFPFGTLSVTDPARPLIVALIFGVLHAWQSRVLRPDSGGTPDGVPAPLWVDMLTYRRLQGRIILCMGVLVGLRLMFKAYEPCLMGKHDGFLLMAVVPLTMLGAVIGASRAALCAHRMAAGSIGWFLVSLWMLFPLAVALHPLTAMALCAAAIVQPAGSATRKTGGRHVAYKWGGVCLCTVLMMLLLHEIGFGWAGKRVLVAISERVTVPGVWFLLCTGGMYAVLRLQPGFRNMVHRTGWLALFGVALAGARGVWGDAGAILFLPMGTMLLMAALLEIDVRVQKTASRCLLHNIVRLCLVGLLFGLVGLNLKRNIFAPDMNRETSRAIGWYRSLCTLLPREQEDDETI